jgi:hypothetical protein
MGQEVVNARAAATDPARTRHRESKECNGTRWLIPAIRCCDCRSPQPTLRTATGRSRCGRRPQACSPSLTVCAPTYPGCRAAHPLPRTQLPISRASSQSTWDAPDCRAVTEPRPSAPSPPLIIVRLITLGGTVTSDPPRRARCPNLPPRMINDNFQPWGSIARKNSEINWCVSLRFLVS